MSIKNPAELAVHLGVDRKILDTARRQRFHVYIKTTMIGKGGKPRELCFPHKDCALKKVQKALKDKCLSDIPLDDAVRGYRKGQHNVNVSQAISGKAFVAKIDVTKFHPHIKPRLVRKALLRKGLTQMLCRTITQLVTFENAIPQGASTSNHIANVVIDYVLAQGVLEFCLARNVQLINFGDDTAFAGDSRAAVDECAAFTKRAFARHGLETNNKSSGAEHVGAARKFIGTCTGRSEADLPRSKFREYRAKLRAAIRAEKAEPVHKVADETTVRSFRGKIAYTKRLNENKARILKNDLFRLFALMHAKDKAWRAQLAKVPAPPKLKVFNPLADCPFNVVESVVTSLSVENVHG